MKTATTYQVTIYIAGDVATIRQVAREFCYERGDCVTITPTSFIYTGGEEEGAAIGLVNYPRFPSSTFQLWSRAEELAQLLLPRCNQRSCSLVGTDETKYISIDPPGKR